MLAIARLVLEFAVSWQAVRPGIWQTEFPFAPSGPLAFVRVVAVRLDPTQLRFTLHSATRADGVRGAWTIDNVPHTGVVAFNAGQFRGGWPWGWFVRDGVEMQAPGTGTLAMALVVDSMGQISLATPDEIPSVRKRAYTAFQSYPALLIGDAEIPWELEENGRGVDLGHHDSRLAICTLTDNTVVVALTRFSGAGKRGETLPFGPTVGAMGTMMRSLGCQRAMLLDGGVSSQLAVRDLNGDLTRWSNWRAVPLGLVISPRN